jgi:hypothetical protein
MTTRIASTFLCDARLQLRNGFYTAAAILTVVSIVALLLAPTQNLIWLLPPLVVNNLIVNGFFFLAGLVLLEKSEGSLEAQIVTPLRSSEYLAAKVGTLTLLSLVENLLIWAVVASFDFQPAVLVTAIVLGTALFASAGFVAVARYDSLNSFLLPGMAAVFLLSLPLLPYFGIGQHNAIEALLYLHPLQPVLTLLSAVSSNTVSLTEIVYGVAAGVGWVTLFAWWANRSFRHFVVEKLNARDLTPQRSAPRIQLRFAVNTPLAQRLGMLRSLGPIDAHTIGRDEMLRWLIFTPLLQALAIRWLLPVILATIEQWMGLELTSYYAPLMGYVTLLLVPYLWGAIIGFLLLDQRDEQTLTALQVTPLPLRSYLIYRLLAPALLSSLATLLVMPITGLFSVPWWAYPLLAFGVAPMAPLAALALAALAENKVQGLALMKAAGVVLLPPMIAYFTPAPWSLLFALAPTWWPAQMLWSLQNGGASWPIYLLGGLLYQTVLLVWLVRHFDRSMHR